MRFSVVAMVSVRDWSYLQLNGTTATVLPYCVCRNFVLQVCKIYDILDYRK